MKDTKWLTEILEQLQYGTTMSDNQEPMLANNRLIATKAILEQVDRLVVEARVDEAKKALSYTTMDDLVARYYEHKAPPFNKKRFLRVAKELEEMLDGKDIAHEIAED